MASAAIRQAFARLARCSTGLAGAVFISGVVALTLSPVMSSKLLDAGREEHGLTGRINRDFDRFRRFRRMNLTAQAP